MYIWYQNIFHAIAVLIVFHSANRKKRTKTILKQDSKSSKEDQNVFVVANPPGSSSNHCRFCRNVVAPLSHRYRSAVAPLSIPCCTAIAPLSHVYCSAVAPLLSLLLSLRNCSCYRLHCCSAVAPMLLRCHSVITPLLLRYPSAVSPLSLRCRFCHNVGAAVASAVATLSLLLLLLLSLHCHYCCRSCVALVLLRYRSVISVLFLYCCSAATAVTPDIAPSIAPSVTPLLLLGLFTVEASRGRIWVTVFIGDCQARVSSPSEGCLTSQKAVKVEAY